jgi:hypothetical protein
MHMLRSQLPLLSGGRPTWQAWLGLVSRQSARAAAASCCASRRWPHTASGAHRIRHPFDFDSWLRCIA